MAIFFYFMPSFDKNTSWSMDEGTIIKQGWNSKADCSRFNMIPCRININVTLLNVVSGGSWSSHNYVASWVYCSASIPEIRPCRYFYEKIYISNLVCCIFDFEEYRLLWNDATPPHFSIKWQVLLILSWFFKHFIVLLIVIFIIKFFMY